MIKSNIVKLLDEITSPTYKYKCHCGNKFISEVAPTRRNRPTHCGCLKKMKEKKPYRKQDAKTRHPLYVRWGNLKSKCAVEEIYFQWHDFIEFKNWAMSTGFAPGKRLTRINKDVGYIAHNCKWS